MESYSSQVLQLRFCMLILPLLLTMMVAPTLQSPLKILDTPGGGTRPDPCALTCSGIGRWNETGYSGTHPGKVYLRVGTPGCNFVSRPVVKATTRSVVSGDCPSVTFYTVTSNGLYFYTVKDATAAEMTSKKCDIHWIAVGYKC